MALSQNEIVEELNKRIAMLKQSRDELDRAINDAELELASALEALADATALPEGQSPSMFELDLFSTQPVVSKASPIEEKYQLFYDLFSGRPDVHAHRFESAKSGKCGYVPACNNENDWSICKRAKKGKEHVRCVDCEHQLFRQLTTEEFKAHLHGEAKNNSDVLGAYPINSEGLCKFVLADFDEDGRKEKITVEDASNHQQKAMRDAAIAFCKTCWMNSVPAYMERSRSGKGVHVWLFFTEPVAVKQARRLLTILITKAMSENSNVSFNSYDMLIPRQDTISKFGFGNLVALPLQGKAGSNKNSLFVNEAMQHYPDQWEFLSTVRKLSAFELDSLLAKLATIDDLGELVCNEEDEDALMKPWEKRKLETSLSASDFNGSVSIVRANMLHITKSALCPRAINSIRRLAAFRNPDFYKHQAMRLETWDKPRIISTAEETSEFLSIPRGCECALTELLESAGAAYNIEDKTEHGRAINASFVGNLREEQMPIANALLEHNIGVLSAPTGFGKTVLSAYLIAERSVNALVLVPNSQLREQWLEALNMFLDIKEEPPEKLTPTNRKKKVEVIGQYSGTKKNTSDIVDVAMIQSLHDNKTGEVRDFVKDYGLVIVDECHHVPAVSFEPVLKHINAKYLYGLTATPFRDDGHHAIIFLECGPIRYKVDAKSQAQKRPFEHYLVPRFTNLLPCSIENEGNYSQMLNVIGMDSKRNQMIAKDITAAIDAGRKPLVLTERTEHVAELAKLVNDTCDNVIVMTGTMPTKEKRDANARLSGLGSEDKFVVIATGSYVGEGFDLPMLDTLFITMPIAYKGKVTQYTGRLHRLFEGKSDVFVYDYVDINVPALEKMYHKRVKGYRAVGYKAIIEQGAVSSSEIIFDKDDYWQKLRDDIVQVNKELIISSPRLAGYQVEKFLQEIATLWLKGAVITVITRPVSEHKPTMQKSVAACIERLSGAGVKIVEKPNVCQQFAVLDQSTVWYGSINLLGYVSKDDSAIRFSDDGIAIQLLSQSIGITTRQSL
jgi:superfamily II DNA or RNA helicase